MPCPNLSGLSLGVCATGADDEHAAAAQGAQGAHPAFGLPDIVQNILANIRDGNVEAACTMATNWCKRATQFNREACNDNEELWKILAERIFPNWKESVMPPVEHATGNSTIEWRRHDPWVATARVPWSDTLTAMPWKEWFFLLCEHYVAGRLKLRTEVQSAKKTRARARRHAQRMQASLDNVPEAARKKGEAPSVKARRILLEREDRLRNAERRWLFAIEFLEQTRRNLLEYERMYGRTTDHPSLVERPAYQPPDPRPEVVREVSAETKAGYEASVEEEARADANWDETWDTHDYKKDEEDAENARREGNPFDGISDSDSGNPFDGDSDDDNDSDGGNPLDGDSDDDNDAMDQ